MKKQLCTRAYPSDLAAKFRKACGEFLIRLTINALARLPLGALYGLGAFIGSLSFRFKNRNKHIAKTNLDLCFPGYSDNQRRDLLEKTLIENAKTLLEAPWLWRHARALEQISAIENEYLLNRASRQGTIFVTPHLGSWELIGLLTAARTDLLILYAPPKSAYLEKLSCQGRRATGASTVSTRQLNIKTLLRHIKNGGSIGILPDQVPAGNGGVYSPFFGRMAYTGTLVCKLANKLKCPVVFGFILRKSRKKFSAYYHQAPKEIFNNDIQTASRSLNKTIEQFILKAPEHYSWSYKKFKNPAPGDSYPY